MSVNREVTSIVMLIAIWATLSWFGGPVEAMPGANPGTAVLPDAPQPGDPAPGFGLSSIDGEEFALQERRGESPMLLVFFRGAW